jgi:hypothetical protein
MAKLEELVTPAELLDMVRKGAMKSELSKKYRASEQDLAMMLLPLYRTEEMTKEEFNDFFSEVPLRAKSSAPQPKPEDEPPSEILASLSKLFGGKKQEAEKPEVPEAPAPPVEVAPPPPPPAAVAPPPRPTPPEPKTEPPQAPPPPPKAEPPQPTAPEPKPEPPKAPAPQAAHPVEAPKEPLNVSSALATILSKLNSIEKRLVNIEKKLAE